MSWFVELQLHYGPLHQEVPRWKHCVLETERGFDLVLSELLIQRTAHREVSGTLAHNELSSNCIYEVDMKCI